MTPTKGAMPPTRNTGLVLAICLDAAAFAAALVVGLLPVRVWPAFETRLPGTFLDVVAFRDARNGFVLGDPIEGRWFLLRTRDAHGLYERYGFTPLADPSRFMKVFRPDLYRVDQPANGAG